MTKDEIDMFLAKLQLFFSISNHPTASEGWKHIVDERLMFEVQNQIIAAFGEVNSGRLSSHVDNSMYYDVDGDLKHSSLGHIYLTSAKYRGLLHFPRLRAALFGKHRVEDGNSRHEISHS